MSFSSMNGINAVRTGLAGTAATMRPLQQRQYSPEPSPLGGPAPAPVNGSGVAGMTVGMMGSNPQAVRRQMNPGLQNYLGYDGATDGSGVAPGVRGPAVPQAPQDPGFDPNDPNNAALAGYMNRG